MAEKNFADIPDLAQHVRIEQRFLPVNSRRDDLITRFRDKAVEQIRKLNLNNQNEQYKLWMYRRISPEGTTHETILKDKGTYQDYGLEKAEFRGLVYPEVFDYYDNDVPSLSHFRYRPNNHVSLDFSESGEIMRAESDNPGAWEHFIRVERLQKHFYVATGNLMADSEWLAHTTFKNQHSGREAFPLVEKPEVSTMFEEIKQVSRVVQKPVVMMGGRSGSGKSFTVRELQKKLLSHKIKPTVVSIDDYNRGRTHLYRLAQRRGQHRWVNYESKEVYNVPLFMKEFASLLAGQPIPRRKFNYDTEESEIIGMIDPNDFDVYIIEGIMATDPRLRGLADLSYEVSTLTATSLGQRSFRDYDERPQFGHPRKNAPYYMTFAEPAFLAATGRGKPLKALPQITRRILDKELEDA